MVSESSHVKRETFVSVVAPIRGDSTDLERYIRKTIAVLKESFADYELILVEGGDTEGVLELIQPLLSELPCIRVLRLSRVDNREILIFAGLEVSIGDFVVIMTPGVDPPSVIGDLVSILQAGHDIVYGISEIRIIRSILAGWGAKLFYWYGKKYLSLNIPPNSTYLFSLNRRSINALTRIKSRYRHIRHLTRQVGFRTATYQYTPEKPIVSAHERGLLDSIRLANEIVVSYSRHPLRVVSTLGLVASGINLVFAIYTIAIYFLKRKVAEGWTTLSLELALMFFVLFIILSVLCEYVGRILEETRARPDYHIMEELNSTVLLADEARINVTK